MRTHRRCLFEKILILVRNTNTNGTRKTTRRERLWNVIITLYEIGAASVILFCKILDIRAEYSANLSNFLLRLLILKFAFPFAPVLGLTVS